MRPVSDLELNVIKTADYVVVGRDKPDGYMGPLGIAADPKRTPPRTKPIIPTTRYTGIDRSGQWKQSVDAYTLSPRANGKEKWVCNLSFKPARSEEHRIYLVQDSGVELTEADIKLKSGSLREIARLSATALTPGNPAQISGFSITPTTKAMTLLIAPESAGVWAGDNKPALVAETPIGNAAKLSLGIGSPESKSRSWEASPFQRVGRPKIHLFPNLDGEITLVLGGDDANFRVLKFRDGKQTASFDLPLSHGVLSSVILAPNGDFYYFTHANGTNPTASVVRASATGELLAKADLGFAENQFDFQSLERTTSSLAFAEQGVCLLTSRTLQNGHQSSFSAVFAPSSLEIIKNHGQNCSHSFANRTILDGGYFITADLGDNYPRGIILHKIARQEKKGRVVYTYKTKHGDRDEPRRNGPDGQPLRAHQWSNDNATYTELGDLVSTNRGYLVVFASEKSVVNDLAKSHHNESRNLGLVLVRKNFEQINQSEAVVPEDLILTKGEDTPPFGFYNYGGRYTRQQNRGVVWLTNFSDKSENVVHPRVAKISSDRFLIIWEKWSSSKFLGSYALAVNELGEPQCEPVKLGSNVRIPDGASLNVVGSQILWVERLAGKAVVYVFKLKAF